MTFTYEKEIYELANLEQMVIHQIIQENNLSNTDVYFIKKSYKQVDCRIVLQNDKNEIYWKNFTFTNLYRSLFNVCTCYSRFFTFH